MAEIRKTPRVSGGAACIGSTRIPVWAVAQLRRLGLDDARILDCYPGLKQSDLDAVAEHRLSRCPPGLGVRPRSAA